jgi:YbbR domain-containing protein
MPRLFARHLGLKVVSGVLAALLWLIVSGEQTVERALRIPLEFTNIPPQLELGGEPPTEVDVRVRGSSGTLSRIAAGELVAVLDVRGARAGQRLFHLTGAEVRAPFGVEVVQVAPSSVSLVLETSSNKTVPVVPEVEGQPADGFVVGVVTADPSTVEVVGPASALAGLTKAVTEAVSVSNASSTVTELVPIGVAEPSVRLRFPQAARVSVSIIAAP